MTILKDFGYKGLPIEFKNDGHTYALGGVPLIGTTTVINCKAKDYLKWWTVKLMYETLQRTWDPTRVYTPEEKEALLLEGKNAHAKRTGKAADSGSISHQLIEDSINNNVRYKMEEINHADPAVQQEVRNTYQNWLDWEKMHKIEYLATEVVAGSKTLWVGGTIDCVAMVDGSLELIDWKTGGTLSEDACIQTSNYKFMLVENGVDPKIGRRVVRLEKSAVTPADDKKIRSDYQTDHNCFKALLTIYRWDRDIEQLNPFNKIKVEYKRKKK